jgi:hypothetical protein
MTGSNLVQPDGTANVASIFAVEVGNPSNVVPASRFVMINPTLIDSFFVFGSGNACKTFQVFVNGPCGPSGATPDAEYKTLCQSPQQRISSLRDTVTGFHLVGVLSKQQAKPLTKKLDKSVNALNGGDKQTSVGFLDAFVDMVKELNGQGTLTAAQSQPLIDRANSIIAQINE